jgi:hypothetical protein
MPTPIYLITSVNQSGGSSNYDYVIDTGTTYSGTFTYGPGVANDKDDFFEAGEQLYYTIGTTVYIVDYDGWVDVNAASATDFGAVTISGVYSVNGDTGDTTDTHGIVLSQFAFTEDGSLPAEDNRAGLPNDTIGTEIPGLICFARGTIIKTDQGLRAIETLKVGDRLETVDNGDQSIRWIGSRRLSVSDLRFKPNLRPIRILAGALGSNSPNVDLVVSPQHRILVRSKIANRMFGESEILVPAKQLIGLPGINIANDIATVTYFHVMCDEHELIEADGAIAETLYTGTEALKSLSVEAVSEIDAIFGEIPYLNRPLARPTPKGRLVKKLVERHIKNNKQLLSSQIR